MLFFHTNPPPYSSPTIDDWQRPPAKIVATIDLMSLVSNPPKKMLVNYSSSSSSDDESNEPCLKKVKTRGKPLLNNLPDPTSTKPAKVLPPPPLPPGFHDIYTVGPKTIQNHALHGGRTRAVAHVEGSWPAHVSLEWFPDTAQAAVLSALVERVRRRHCHIFNHPNGQGLPGLGVIAVDTRTKMKRKKQKPLLLTARKPDINISNMQLESLVRLGVGARLPLHVSLSDTMMVPGPEKEAYRTALRTAVQTVFHEIGIDSSSKKKQEGTITIELDTTRAMVFANEANTRGFVALAVVNPEGLIQVSLPKKKIKPSPTKALPKGVKKKRRL
jgi:hypothetical protein